TGPSPIPANVNLGSMAKLRVHGDGFEMSSALKTPLRRHRQLTLVSLGGRSNSYTTPARTTTAMPATAAANMRLGQDDVGRAHWNGMPRSSGRPTTWRGGPTPGVAARVRPDR